MFSSRPCHPCFAAAVVLITEAGVVLTHVWAREDHTHAAHRPWIEGLGDCWHELQGQTVALQECDW